MSASIRINGISISGANVTINNNRVLVDGVDVTPEGKKVNIEVTGDVAALTVDSCDLVKINGNAAKIRTVSGDVHCGDVAGAVQTVSGDVTCGDVGGDVRTMSGDVTVHPMQGGANG